MKIWIHRACHYLYEKSPLIASIAFLLFINRHIFFQPFVPGADTIAKYDNFYFFYNEYFYHGHIAQWTPFVQHGMPAGYYQLDALGPSAYFAFILGKILQITDVSFLFKISVLVDLLALLLGMYLLAKEFFKSHFIVSVLCISVLCITDWQWEIGFQVYMRYLLPLAAYFFLGFYKKGRAGYFWVGWIIAFLSGMGASPYVQIIGLFSLFLLNLFLWWAYRPSWTKSREGAIHILPFIVLIILVFCVYHQLYAFRDFAATPNREIGQKNSLITFLMWEPWTQRGSLMVFLQDNIFGNYKNNFNYIGILPTLFLIYAVFTIRTREFLAFLFTGVAMWWLSCGGIFASLLYYFPCMAYYRNLGLAYNVYNVFFILCAGFGIQRFLDMPTRDKIKILAAGLIVLFLIADGLGFRTDWVRHLKIYKTLEVFLKHIPFTYYYFRMGIYVIGFILLVLAAVFRYWQKRDNRHPGARDVVTDYLICLVLFCCFILDLCSYASWAEMRSCGYEPYLTQTHKVEYSGQCHNDQKNIRQASMAQYMLSHTGLFQPMYNALQYGACTERFIQLMPKNVVELFKMDRKISRDNFNIITACGSPKLRLVSGAIFSPDEKDTQKLLRSTADFSNIFVAGGQGAKEMASQPPSKQGSADTAPGSIDVKAFTTDSITVDADVSSPQGAWLVYTDSYHPGWKVTVNGVAQKTLPANLAFKAVHLGTGHQVVQWVFDDLPGRLCSYFIALICVIFMIAVLALFLMAWLPS